ncbi:MAG TPA: pitrilysin family protein [Chitinophagales bacterium]|nr:insulinase family protein [Chitinophagales bacterium]MBP6155026.1 insulinase family protein [Chitinophagales bacterium]HQV77249.1 pitrilysin family protein [Chitinophagales bacterium]HQW79748.1 pitrilysin family protein [Chitinophagales bacterium]HRB67585.1 pitrilysin family protein [Chitinophagales bacterium]
MIDYSKEILENGLTILHHYDETTPFVVVNTLYHVGAKDEDEQKTGFAHLFEHLMFSGSKHFKDFDKPLQEAGGENNAFTNNDYTNYYDIVPAINIETPLALEADRMLHLNINKKSLDVQRKVVCEEFKENYINQPYGNAWHILREMVYSQHPYKWPTIGKELKHIENATLEDVQAFYNTYYQPKNAILVIAGNIEKNNALQLCEKYFTSTKNSDCIHHTFTEPIQTTATQKTIQEEVPLNAIYIAFKMCDRLHPDYYVADITSDILANGTSSRLHQRLVKEAKAFVDMDAYITASNDIGMFVFEGKVSEGYDVYHAEQLVWKEIEQIKQDLVPEKELQKCKNKVLTYQNFSESSLLNRAISLAYYELLGNANLINEEEQHYEAIQTTDIQRFAKATFDKEKSNTLYYLKKDYLTK